MKKNNEENLIEIIEKCRLATADKSDWEELYKYCFPRIYIFLRAIGLKMGFPLTDLEDITQNIFIKLIEKFPKKKFVSIKNFNKYLDAICKNYLIDLLRNLKRKKILLQFEEYEKIISEPEYLYQSESYEIKEAKVLMIEGIKKLPINCKKILNPLIKEETSLAEIARRYKIPQGSIYTQYKRCIKKLKKILENM